MEKIKQHMKFHVLADTPSYWDGRQPRMRIRELLANKQVSAPHKAGQVWQNKNTTIGG